MTLHFFREVERLNRMLLSLSATVEEQLQRAVASVMDRDAQVAQEVIGRDDEVDQLEVDIEEEGLKILALHQPVASDLRFIVAVLKMNADLERIGDLAVNIAERAVFLSSQGTPNTAFDFHRMAELVQAMLRDSLDALINQDAKLAQNVVAGDEEVDAIHRQTYEQIKAGIRREPEHLDAFIHMLSISRNLERVGDHATNIAEEVMYMVKGDIVRHKRDE